MAGQVGFNLAFGLDHEAQAPAVTGQSGQAADGEGAAPPQWIQVAGCPAVGEPDPPSTQGGPDSSAARSTGGRRARRPVTTAPATGKALARTPPPRG